MNNKRLIKKVLKKFALSGGSYPLRKYSINLKYGSVKDCRRVIGEIEKNLIEAESMPTFDKLASEIKKLPRLEDKEIHLFLFALTYCVFQGLLNDTLSLNGAVLLLSETENYDGEEFYTSASEVNRILGKNNPHNYRKSDLETKERIRKRVYSFAKNHGISEIEAARIYTPEKSFGKILFGKLFFPCLTLFSLLLDGFVLFFIGFVPFILLFFPIYEVLRSLSIYFISKIMDADFIPRLDGVRIPDSGRCVTVITSLICSDNIQKLLSSIEDIYNRNSDENVLFGILADLPEHSDLTSDNDGALTQKISEGIRALNFKYGEHFCLFVRGRKYMECQRKFCGRERKRGAIIDLCAFLEHGNDEGFQTIICKENFISKTNYLITLDFDTIPFHGDIHRMVMAMLHPDNRPIIENGRVVRGFGILQPSIVLSPESASASPFSLTLFGSGGADNYRIPHFELYQSIFGRGIFCGKGIIDIKTFNKIIPCAFQDEKILSHDILEGAYLRAGYLSDTVLADSCPKNPISYYKRLHRWIRGDVQNLLYLGKTVPTASGERVKNPMDALSRHMLIDNIRRALLMPFIFLFLTVIVLFYQNLHPFAIIGAALIALSPILLPFFINILQSLKKSRRKFYSNTLQGLCHSFCNTLYFLCALPSEAFTALDATFRSLWRMYISGEKLLEWTTAEVGEKVKGAAGACFIKFLPSFFSGVFFLLLAPHPIFDFLGVLWMLFPILAAGLSKPYDLRIKEPSRSQKKQMEKYCRDAWGYFRTFVSERTNYLPPDNHQERPSPVTAERTSPTNIGLYLISIVGAEKFSFISKSEALDKIEKTLKTLQILPKYGGHLYNWYDTSTLFVIGTPYISTVDSGNLAACLVILRSALPILGDDGTLGEICGKLLEDMKFDFLYNKKKKMLSLGFNTSNETLSDNCYDLLMSEARTAVYFAICRGEIPVKAWERMSRPLIIENGHGGIMSWSGTAFEYFMPSIFLPVYNGTLFYEALSFALSMQMRSPAENYWGRSESAYFAFDYDMNYQYRAFGVPKLSYDDENSKNDVISPYSSFLALSLAKHAPLSNLGRLKDLGAYGKFGFYEAVDFTARRVGRGHAIIYSYMSHHIGMSIASCVNAVFGGYFNDLFMQDEKMRSGRTLLYEKIPSGTFEDEYRHPKATDTQPLKIPSRAKIPEASAGHLPSSASYSGGLLRLSLLSDGKITLFYKDKALFYPFFQNENFLRLFGLRLLCSGKLIDPLKNAAFTPYLTGATYKGRGEGVSYQIDLSLSEKFSALCIGITAAGAFNHITTLMLFEPVLDGVRSFSAHPAFSGLSVSSYYDRDSGILFYRRKERDGNHRETWLGVRPFCNGEYEFLTRRDEAFLSNYSESDIDDLIKTPFSSNDGACILPFCAVKKSSETKGGKYHIDFLIFAADSKKEILARYALLHSDKKILKKGIASAFSKDILSLAERNFLISGADMTVINLVCTLRSIFLTKSRSCTRDMPVGERGIIYSMGISGDIPIVCLIFREVPAISGKEIISAFARACRYMKLQGEEFDLLFICHGEDEANPYTSPIRNEILKTVTDAVGYSPLYRKGGIFISSLCSKKEIYPFAHVCLSLKKEDILTGIIENLRKIDSPAHDTKLIKKITPHSSQIKGEFLEDGFLIKKGISKRPWSYIYSTRLFGTLITQNSLGFTFYRNSRELRLTPWNNDPLLDCHGEIIVLHLCGERYDLAAISDSVVYKYSHGIYRGSVGGLSYEMEVGISPELPLKYIKVILTCEGEIANEGELEYLVLPDLGDGTSMSYKTTRMGDYMVYTNADTGKTGNISAFSTTGSKKFTLQPSEKKTEVFLLGAFNRRRDRAFYYMTGRAEEGSFIEEHQRKYRELFAPIETTFKLKCPDKSLERMFNYYAPYTALATRQFARSAFYQSGGAYGFRDQLQDAICLAPIYPELLKRQILRSAACQFIQGDVLHWWHQTPGRPGDVFGVRTKCSDDYLWLPLALWEYTEATGDLSLANIPVKYLEAPEIYEGKAEMMVHPVKSHKKESVFYHCVRALERGIANISSENGLSLMGSCDWNDGFSNVGIKGRGTSVWLSRFLQLTLDRFSLLCQKLGQRDLSVKFTEIAEKLGNAVEEKCYNGEYYLRAFYDDGTPMGSTQGDGCAIDILPQAFSVFTSGKTERTKKAMKNSMERLYDGENCVFRLFTPAFDDPPKNPGYIASYVPGVRENGGQYTHGTLWGALAFFKLGNCADGCRILKTCNPASRYEDQDESENLSKASNEVSNENSNQITSQNSKQNSNQITNQNLNQKTNQNALWEKYGGEPYAHAGDVYYNPDFKGRCGWTHYTGAAGWFFKTVLDGLIGYTHHGEGYFTLSPLLGGGFEFFDLEINKNATVYHISAREGEENKYVLDGKECENRFIFDKKEHYLKITVEKIKKM